jgi:hypothetical protein
MSRSTHTHTDSSGRYAKVLQVLLRRTSRTGLLHNWTATSLQEPCRALRSTDCRYTPLGTDRIGVSGVSNPFLCDSRKGVQLENA